MSEKSLPWIRVNNKLTIVLPNGQNKTVTEDNKELFDKVIECIKLGEWEKIPDLLDTKAAIYNFSDGIFEVINGTVHINNKSVPNGLSKKIISFAKEGLPYKPLLNFWEKLQKNVSYRNVQGLYDFLEVNNYPITEDGDIIAYKKIKEDWTDCHTGTIFNYIGTIVSMPRNEVNDNPELVCQAGFHVGNYAFCWDFREGRMIIVSVNPEHVVSMPTAYEFTKMRICEYTVLKEVAEEEKGNLYKNVVDNSEEDEYDSEDDHYNDISGIDEDCDCVNYDCESYSAHHDSCQCKAHPLDCPMF